MLETRLTVDMDVIYTESRYILYSYRNVLSAYTYRDGFSSYVQHSLVIAIC